MSANAPIEIRNVGEVRDLAGRILKGEVFVLRQGLQQLGLFEPLVDGTLEGIRKAKGAEVADQVRAGGFDRIHEWITPLDLPPVTDAVYEVLTPRALGHLKTLVPRVFPGAGTFYYEKAPNIRFHIPFDHASRYRREFDKFAEKRGQGKIAAHGPHRDQWVDCPANAINIWIAIGPVRQGNSLTVFNDDYEKPFAFKDGYILNGERLHKPLSFDLDPGDAVLFLSSHLHGSELNRTDRTRYVVSYRVTFGKPHYPHGHYHHYVHSGLAAGPLHALAGIPQNLQGSFFRYQLQRVRIKLTGKGRMSAKRREGAPPAATGTAGPPTFSSRTATVALPLLSVAWSMTRCGPAVGKVQVTVSPSPSSNWPSSFKSQASLSTEPSGSSALAVSVAGAPGGGGSGDTAMLAVGARLPGTICTRRSAAAPSLSVTRRPTDTGRVPGNVARAVAPVASSNWPSPSRSHACVSSRPSGSEEREVKVAEPPCGMNCGS